MKFTLLSKLFVCCLFLTNLHASDILETVIFDLEIIFGIFLLILLAKYLKNLKQKKELQTSLDLFKTAINYTLTSVIIIKNKEIEYFSDEAKKLFLLEDDSKFLGHGFLRFVHKDYREAIIKDIKNKEKDIYDVLLLKANKESFPALIQSKEMNIEDESFYVLSIMDITSIKRQEQERFLFHESKLSSMGSLVGNIAHQWRQPLISLGNIVLKLDAAQMFDKKLEEKDLTQYTNEIKTTVRFMSETINTFQDFYQLENHNVVVFDVKKPISDILNMLSGRFSNFFIQIDIEDLNSIEIKGIPSELAHTILIIFENIIEIVEHKQVQNAQVKISTYAQNKDIIIDIEDNLEGIDKNIIENIFEPYVTTKIKKQSTGMGLYIAKTIIENKMHGMLTANNTKKGAIFKIKLPFKK
ncbi:MAG: HAMP domain-containing histidine kinase [Campylobacteraceae bacterium]|nr:HAMP domain-containing histidine kinase [Campylobacteraceae bacterium]